MGFFLSSIPHANDLMLKCIVKFSSRAKRGILSALILFLVPHFLFYFRMDCIQVDESKQNMKYALCHIHVNISRCVLSGMNVRRHLTDRSRDMPERITMFKIIFCTAQIFLLLFFSVFPGRKKKQLGSEKRSPVSFHTKNFTWHHSYADKNYL